MLFSSLVGCNSINDIDDGEGETITPTQNDYYLAKFINYDKSFLYQGYFKATEKVTYKGNTPVRENDDSFTYTFVGWDKELTYITQDTVYTAQYTSRPLETYTVSFVNYDGTVLYETSVKEGEDVFYVGDNPTRPDDEDGTSYTFVGWNKDTGNIQDDTVFTAVYTAKKVKIVVRFLNYDGSVLDIQYVTAGEGVNYVGPTPTRPDDGATVYTFYGWDTDTSYITKDTDITALYTESKRKVVVTFVNFDGSLLDTQEVEYGEGVEYNGETPIRNPEGRYEYEFSGWSVETEHIYSDTVVTAKYDKLDRRGTDGLYYSWNSWWYNNTYYEGYFVTGYDGSEKDIFIPKKAMVDGTEQPIVGISNAFQWNDNIESIFIEDNVKYIYGNAFYYLNNLKTVRLSEGLERIEQNAFYNLPNLEEINIPASTYYVHGNAFSRIDFAKCKITIHKNNPYFAIDEDIYIVDKNKTTIYSILCSSNISGELSIPEGYKTIKSYAFRTLIYNGDYLGSAITKVVIPSTMELIEHDACWNNNYLKELVFNDCPVKIESNAFGACYNLTNVDFGKAVISIGDGAFSSDPIEEVWLPKTLTYLSPYAFGGTNIKSLIIEEGNEYFHNMSILVLDKDNNVVFYPNNCGEKLVIDSKFTGSLDMNLLRSSNITGIEVESGNPNYYAKDDILYDKNKTNLICGFATSKTKLTASDIPSSVTNINYMAFYNNQTLTSVDLKTTSITYISSNAFQACFSLKTVTLPTGLTSLESNCFTDCDALEEITLPNSLTSLRSGMFNGCDNLKSVTLPNSLQTIESWAFGGCVSLKSIEIPNTVKQIYDYVFYRCTSLESIDIPEGVTYLGYDTFYCCTSLKSVDLPDSLTEIQPYCFQECTTLESITIPKGVTYIGYGAFDDCRSLVEVNFECQMTQINENSIFYNCQLLKKVTLPSTLEYLNLSIFHYCSALEYLVLPASFKGWVNYDYFEGCDSFKSFFLLGDYTDFYVDSSINIYTYSETKAEGCWHYDDNGNPVAWIIVD